MTYSGSPNPDPGEVKRDEETLQRQREEKAEQDRIEEERRILEEEVPYWRRQEQIEGGDFIEDPEGPHYASIAAETGIGIATDFATVGLLGIPVVGQGLYYGTNFTVGYAANALAQWMRGDWDNFSQGEALAAGGFQTIPMGTTAKGLKGLRKAATKGALGGVTMAQLEVGVDERRRLTTRELMLSGILGGTVAGGFKSAELGGDVIGDVIRNPYQLAPEGSLARMMGDTGGGIVPPPDAGKFYKEGLKGTYEVSPHMKRKLLIHDRAHNEDLLAFDPEAELRRSIIDKELDPRGPIIIRAGADLKRKRSAYLLSGEEITPEVDAAFKAEGHQILTRYEKKLGLSVGEVDIHHKGLLRQIFEATNGLNDEFRLKSAKFMQSRLGHELGYAKSAAEPLPKQFHRRLHNLINKRIGIGGYNLKAIEKKLGLPKNWQQVLTYDERLPIYREIIDTIADSEKQIKRFWNGLLRRTDLTKLTRDNYMETVLEVLELDKRLQKTPGIGFSAGQDSTASEIINDILIKAGRIDLTLPIFQQLSKAKSEEAARIIMQTNGRKALLEAIEANKSIDTVFDAYKVQGDRRLVKSVMKTWKKRFPNQPEKLKKLINETDLEGKHADLKLLEKLIQDPDF